MNAMDVSFAVPGAGVAEYTYGGHRGTSVELSTVERLTATLIVLTNGHRYRRDTLEEARRRSSWGAWTVLMPADDERVRNGLARQTLRALVAWVGTTKVEPTLGSEDVVLRLELIADRVAKALAKVQGGSDA